MDDDNSSVATGVEITAGFRQHLNRQLRVNDDDDDSHGGEDQPTPRDMSGGYAAVSSPTKQSAAYLAEIQRLREALSTTATGPVEAKYLEQLKRSRDLQVKLESERAKNTKLTARIVMLEKEKHELVDAQQLAKAVGLPSSQRGGTGRSTAAGAPEADVESDVAAEERLEKATKTIASLRKSLDDHKREAARLRRVLQLELGGDDGVVESALKTVDAVSVVTDGSSVTVGPPQPPSKAPWKGRAEQIVILKGKVKDLERQLRQTRCDGGDDASSVNMGGADDRTETATVRTGISYRTGVTALSGTATTRDFDDVNRSAVELKQRKQQSQVRELQLLVDQKSKEADDEKRKGESFQARLNILDRDNQHLRNCLQRIVEKTENDDKLIQAYKAELETKRSEMRRVMTANASLTARVGPRGQTDAQVIEQLEAEISRLHDQIGEMRRAYAQSSLTTASQAWDASSALGNADEAGTQSMESAVRLVEDQRKIILALEAQLQKRDKQLTSKIDSVQGCDDLLREENVALKHRIRALSDMMEREIALHEAVAAQRVAAAQAARDAVSAAMQDIEGGLDVPPSRGGVVPLPPISRPTSTASTTSTGGTRDKDRSSKARRTSSTEVESSAKVQQQPQQGGQEFDSLKRQYDDLKRAFNTLQAKVMSK